MISQSSPLKVAESAEVSGASVQIIIASMGNVKAIALKILEENQVDTKVSLEGWSNLGKWINALHVIEQRFGPNTIFMIGKKVPEVVPFPPQVNSFDVAMNSVNQTYLSTHRNISSSVDYYKFKMTGNNSAVMICENPYPSEFDRGLIAGLARKFPPKGIMGVVEVKLDETQPTRKQGAKSCTYLLTWK